MSAYLKVHLHPAQFGLALLLAILLPVTALAEDLKIGAIFSLSGYGAHGGSSELNATQLAVDEINAAGGVKPFGETAPRKLRLIIEDNRSEPKTAVTAFKRLSSVENTKILLGPNWSEFAEVVAPLAHETKTLMLTASGYSKSLTVGKPLVFTTSPRLEEIVSPLARHIAKHAKRIALATSKNLYHDMLADNLFDALGPLNVKISKRDSFEPAEFDYRSYISKVKKEGFDSVVAFLLNNGETASFLKQARQLGFAGTVYMNGDVILDSLVVKDRSIANGVVYFDFLLLATDDFTGKYRARFKDEPVLTAVQAYDNVYLIREALQECGTETINMGACLEQVDYHGASGRIRFTPDHKVVSDGRKISELYRVVDGKSILFEE